MIGRFNINELVCLFCIVLDEKGQRVSGLQVQVDIEKPDGLVISGIMQELINFANGAYKLEIDDTALSGVYKVRFKAEGFPSTISWFLVENYGA